MADPASFLTRLAAGTYLKAIFGCPGTPVQQVLQGKKVCSKQSRSAIHKIALKAFRGVGWLVGWDGRLADATVWDSSQIHFLSLIRARILRHFTSLGVNLLYRYINVPDTKSTGYLGFLALLMSSVHFSETTAWTQAKRYGKLPTYPPYVLNLI